MKNYIIIQAVDAVFAAADKGIPVTLFDAGYLGVPSGINVGVCVEEFHKYGSDEYPSIKVNPSKPETLGEYEELVAVTLAFLGHEGYPYASVHYECFGYGARPEADYILRHRTRDHDEIYAWDLTKAETYDEIRAYLGEDAVDNGKVTIYRWSSKDHAFKTEVRLLRDIIGYTAFEC